MLDPVPEIPAEIEAQSSAKTHAEASRQRRDLVSGAVMDEARLIRFVAAPDGTVTPDLGRKLPGRGMWVEATRAAVDQAARKGGFSRSAKAKLNAPHDLADQVETLLARQCLDRLGLARRAGALTSGFEKVSALVSSGRAAWLIEASDGSADGRRKLLALARHAPKPPKVCGAFDADELSLALGLGHAIHTAFSAGRWAERWSEALGRLAGFRPILPERWSEEA
jgi:predicted RNA-binding protein YlxR (DUF448 family)